MSAVRTAFTYLPFAVWAANLLVYVLPCRYRTRAQAVWAMALLACAAKFLCYGAFGGDAFVPELPEKVIWLWNWAHAGAATLFALSAAWFVAGLVLRPFVTAPPWALAVRRVTLPTAAWTLSLWGLWSGIAPPEVREVELGFRNLPAALDGYRVCQLADLHVSSGARRWRTERIVAAANATGADLIVCTGDIVDGLSVRRHRDVEPLKGLAAKDGVWFVTGNHERYGDWPEWERWYDRWGIRFLRDECALPRPGLALGGIDDASAAKLPDGSSADVRALGGVFAKARPGDFRLLLQHRPDMAAFNFRALGADLQLSGHAHGGVMPGLSWLVARCNGGFVRGEYEVAPGRWLYVSPGCGQWAGFPIRLFNPTEISLVTLRCASGRPAGPLAQAVPAADFRPGRFYTKNHVCYNTR